LVGFHPCVLPAFPDNDYLGKSRTHPRLSDIIIAYVQGSQLSQTSVETALSEEVKVLVISNSKCHGFRGVHSLVNVLGGYSGVLLKKSEHHIGKIGVK
jgi:hypothetical protein